MRRGFTIVEMLTVLGVIVLMVGVLGTLFADAWVMTGRARKEAEWSQLAGVLLKLWQREIHATDPAAWAATNDTFSAGPLDVRREGRTLFFRTPAGTHTLHLPNGVECRFAVERNGPLTDCAVLYLEFTTYRYRTAQPQSLRLVACTRRNP